MKKPIKTIITIVAILLITLSITGCENDSIEENASKTEEAISGKENIPENIMNKFRRDIDQGATGNKGFGNEWGFSEYQYCINGENGKIYGLATLQKNVNLTTAITEIDIKNNRMRFLEVWQDTMTYSNLRKVSDDKYDKSWQESDDLSSPVNKYCEYLRKNYDKIPLLEKNKKYYRNDIEEVIDEIDKFKKQQDNLSNEKSKSSGNIKESKSDLSSIQKNANHLMSDVSLGSIEIGVDVSDVLKNMGQAREVTHSDDAKKTYYKYADIDLTIMNGKVIGFVSNTSKLATPHGISQGDSLKKVLSVYGDPYAKSEYDGATLYEYKLTGLENIPCILRFAIKDSKVDYISGRVLDN